MKILPLLAQNGVGRTGAVVSGLLWAGVYNLLWGAAWLAFVRREWTRAAEALGESMPWTAEVWLVWIVLTVPLGSAMMAYVASTDFSPRNVVVPSTAVWLLLTTGMVTWGLAESLSLRVLSLDSVANLVAMTIAFIIAASVLRSLQAVRNRGSNWTD
jgi:hypothetical protein